MDLGPEKVTSTCPQRFAELDPDSSHMLLAAPERFRDDADACRLSMGSCSRFTCWTAVLSKQNQRDHTSMTQATRMGALDI